MPVGELIRGLFIKGPAKLVNTNRAFYMRSLSLVIACRSLPEFELSKLRSGQMEALEGYENWIRPFIRSTHFDFTEPSVFQQVETALRQGTTLGKIKKEAREKVEEQFSVANLKLTTYLKVYYGAEGRGLDQDLAFNKATRHDREAIVSFTEFSQRLEGKIQEIKGLDVRKIPVTFWGQIPAEITKDNEIKTNSNVVYNIKIENRATLDTLLHRAMEYATVAATQGMQDYLLGSTDLRLYPQFYDAFPLDDEGFSGKKKIPSLSPTSRVKKLSTFRDLNLIPNRAPLLELPPLLPQGRGRIAGIAEYDISELCTNTWPVKTTQKSGPSEPKFRCAVRVRTPSHSLYLLDDPYSIYSTPQTPSIAGSTTTLLDESQTASHAMHATSQHPSSYGFTIHGFGSMSNPRSPATTSVDSTSTLSGSQGWPTDSITMPVPDVPPGNEVVSNISHERHIAPIKAGLDIKNPQKFSVIPGNSSTSLDSETQGSSQTTDTRAESPNQDAQIDSDGKTLPSYSQKRHRVETYGLERRDVAVKEKKKSKPRNLIDRILRR